LQATKEKVVAVNAFCKGVLLDRVFSANHFTTAINYSSDIDD